MGDEGKDKPFYSAPHRSEINAMVGNGQLAETKFGTELEPYAFGPMKGRSYHVNVNPEDDNYTPMLIGVDYLKLNRVIIDF